MAGPKDLLSRGLGIIEQEMTRLESNAKANGTRENPDDPDSPIVGGLSGVQSNKLCSYMTTLRQLVDKDLSGDNVDALPEDELRRLAATYGSSNGEPSHKPERKRKSQAVSSGG